jgi:hypothetical protein
MCNHLLSQVLLSQLGNAKGGLMFGIPIAMPFLAAIGDALFATLIYGQNTWESGEAIGFGVGCSIITFIWLPFAMPKGMAK